MKLDLNSLQRLVQYGNAALAWGRKSPARKQLMWTLVIAGFGLALIARLEWHFAQRSNESRHHGAQVLSKSRESGLQLAYDRIGDCIRSRTESAAQQKWYCDRAISEYRRALEGFPSQYVDVPIQKRLFLAMQTEVAHSIRSEALQGMRARDQDRLDEQRFMLELVAWGVAGVVVLGWTFYRLWLWEPHKPVIRNVMRGVRGKRSQP